jgi:hypothetical protein
MQNMCNHQLFENRISNYRAQMITGGAKGDLKNISKNFPKNSKFLAEKNFSNFAQNYPVMVTHYHVIEAHKLWGP